MKTPKILCSLAALALAQGSLFAVNTDPVGFVSVSVLAHSDAILAVPMNRTSEFKGLTSALSGTTGTVTISVAGSPGWTAGQFAPLTTANKTYALQFASGAKEGLILPITGNDVNTVTVTVSATDNLTGVLANGEQIDIMPYWTPAALITSPPLATAILGFNTSGAGIDRGPGEIYAFDGTNWQDDVNGGPPVNHTPLPFGTSFVLRNNSGATYNLSMVGSVPMTKFRVLIATLQANTTQDIQIGYMSPVPESLTSLEFPAVAGDSILGFDNSEAGIDKGPTLIYAYDGTKWVDDVLGGDVPSTVKLQPGFGYVFRKNQTASPQSLVWTHLPGYLQ